MYDYMLPMSNRGIISVAKRAFDLVDARLMGHGQRVASIMYQLMKADGGYDGRKMRDMLTLAVLHDIGAYKTEEIDKMVEFETENVWNHSIYGYLFFYYFSLLKELSGIVLYHHTPWNVLRRMDHVPDHIKKHPSFSTWRTGSIFILNIQPGCGLAETVPWDPEGPKLLRGGARPV